MPVIAHMNQYFSDKVLSSASLGRSSSQRPRMMSRFRARTSMDPHLTTKIYTFGRPSSSSIILLLLQKSFCFCFMNLIEQFLCTWGQKLKLIFSFFALSLFSWTEIYETSSEGNGKSHKLLDTEQAARTSRNSQNQAWLPFVSWLKTCWRWMIGLGDLEQRS